MRVDKPLYINTQGFVGGQGLADPAGSEEGDGEAVLAGDREAFAAVPSAAAVGASTEAVDADEHAALPLARFDRRLPHARLGPRIIQKDAIAAVEPWPQTASLKDTGQKTIFNNAQKQL